MANLWDENSDKLVYGYVHEFETDIVVIPDGIIRIILLYFFRFVDDWDIETSSEYALIDGKFLSNKTVNKRFSTFGTHEFNKGSHEWKFKIHSLAPKDKNWLYFGIATKTEYGEDDFWGGNIVLDTANDPDYHSFAFGTSGWISNLGIICHPTYSGTSEDEVADFHWYEGDELVMKLDLSKAVLIFEINGKEIVKMDDVYNDFENKPDVKYRMANSIMTRTSCIKIELVSYECLADHVV